MARVVSSATETVRALGPDVEDGEGDENYRKLFNDSYGSIEAVFEEFARKKNLSFEDPDTMDELLSAGNEMACPLPLAAILTPSQQRNARNGPTQGGKTHSTRCPSCAKKEDSQTSTPSTCAAWPRRVARRGGNSCQGARLGQKGERLEKEAYDEFLVAVDEFEYVDRKRELAVDKQERPIAEIALWALRYDRGNRKRRRRLIPRCLARTHST